MLIVGEFYKLDQTKNYFFCLEDHYHNLENNLKVLNNNLPILILDSYQRNPRDDLESNRFHTCFPLNVIKILTNNKIGYIIFSGESELYRNTNKYFYLIED